MGQVLANAKALDIVMKQAMAQATAQTVINSTTGGAAPVSANQDGGVESSPAEQQDQRPAWLREQEKDKSAKARRAAAKASRARPKSKGAGRDARTKDMYASPKAKAAGSLTGSPARYSPRMKPPRLPSGHKTGRQSDSSFDLLPAPSPKVRRTSNSSARSDCGHMDFMTPEGDGLLKSKGSSKRSVSSTTASEATGAAARGSGPGPEAMEWPYSLVKFTVPWLLQDVGDLRTVSGVVAAAADCFTLAPCALQIDAGR